MGKTTKQVVDEATRIAAKSLREPKIVRDGTVKVSKPKVLSINHMSDRQRDEISRLIMENTVSY